MKGLKSTCLDRLAYVTEGLSGRTGWSCPARTSLNIIASLFTFVWPLEFAKRAKYCHLLNLIPDNWKNHSSYKYARLSGGQSVDFAILLYLISPWHPDKAFELRQASGLTTETSLVFCSWLRVRFSVSLKCAKHDFFLLYQTSAQRSKKKVEALFNLHHQKRFSKILWA